MVLEIVLVGLCLAEACAEKCVAVVIVGVRIQAVVGVEAEGLWQHCQACHGTGLAVAHRVIAVTGRAGGRRSVDGLAREPIDGIVSV